MNIKFKPGEKALHAGVEVIVKVASKNMATKQMSYLLENGMKVAEKDLQKVQGGKPAISDEEAELVATRGVYQAVFGKPVAPVKKNDKEWVKAKIKAYKDANPAAPTETKEATAIRLAKEAEDAKYLAVSVLNREQLALLITEKELEIDEADYTETDDLLIAVCDELEITIPQ